MALARVQKRVDDTVGALNEVIEKGVPEINKKLAETGVGRIDGGVRLP